MAETSKISSLHMGSTNLSMDQLVLICVDNPQEMAWAKPSVEWICFDSLLKRCRRDSGTSQRYHRGLDSAVGNVAVPFPMSNLGRRSQPGSIPLVIGQHQLWREKHKTFPEFAEDQLGLNFILGLISIIFPYHIFPLLHRSHPVGLSLSLMAPGANPRFSTSLAKESTTSSSVEN